MDSLSAFDKVYADAQSIKEKGNFIPDCSTKQGYEASKQYVLKETTKARSALSAAHKEAKAYYLDGGRTVDAKKNELMEILLNAEAPHKQAYKAVDEEKKRIKAEKDAAIQNGFDTIKGYAELALNQSSDYINQLIDDCSSFDCDPEVFGKELPKIIELQSSAMNRLTDAYTSALKYEDMQRKEAEMAAKMAEIEAKEAAQREAEDVQRRAEQEAIQREQMRLEAEQAAAAQVEQAKLEAEQAEARRIEQEKQAIIDAENTKALAAKQAKEAATYAKEQAELSAKEAAEQERHRIEQLAAQEKAEAEAREADKKHRSSINRQAMNCLIAGGLSEAHAKLAVKLVASKKIAHIQINY